MENGTARYIETVAYLGKLYDFANERLFNGELKKPVITVQRDERNKTNGWAATLIHEMCHQFASMNNMQDCSRSGTYHNKLFKKIAETHGLKVECVPQIGWSHTELTEETAAMINEFVAENPATVIYRLPVAKGQTVKTSSTRKYVCPLCGQSVRATKQVNIICADCDAPMQEEV